MVHMVVSASVGVMAATLMEDDLARCRVGLVVLLLWTTLFIHEQEEDSNCAMAALLKKRSECATLLLVGIHLLDLIMHGTKFPKISSSFFFYFFFPTLQLRVLNSDQWGQSHVEQEHHSVYSWAFKPLQSLYSPSLQLWSLKGLPPLS